VFYIAQVETNPPTIAMVVNKPAMFEGSYERFLLNRMRDEIPFSEVPIKLLFSARKRDPAAAPTRKSGTRGKPATRHNQAPRR
jgi:GTP-binding protein